MDFRSEYERKTLVETILKCGGTIQGAHEEILGILDKSLKRYKESHTRPQDLTLWPFPKTSLTESDEKAGLQKIERLFDHVSLLQCTEKDIAIELTLIAEARAQSMHARDYIRERYKNDNIFRNQSAITEKFCNWISTSILLNVDDAKREKVMRSWIKVAYYCFKLRNYMTLVEIITAMSIAPVHRLKSTKHVLRHPKFEHMRVIMSYKSNYKAYRSHIKNHKRGAPWVPYFGLIMKDMFGLEHSQPKMKVHEAKGVKVYFDRCLKIHMLLKEVFVTQKYTYAENLKNTEMKSNPALRKFFQDTISAAQGLDSLFELSYEIQPRASTRSATSSPSKHGRMASKSVSRGPPIQSKAPKARLIRTHSSAV
ncbi:hypothetical protein AAMO2058_000894500 [Amorphochlora amoebiformis]